MQRLQPALICSEACNEWCHVRDALGIRYLDVLRGLPSDLAYGRMVA